MTGHKGHLLLDRYFEQHAGDRLSHGESPFYRFQEICVEPAEDAVLRGIDGTQRLGDFRSEGESLRRTIYGLIAAGFLSAFLLNEDRSSRKLPLYGLVISLLLCIGVAVSLGVHIHTLQTRQFAVILSDAVDVRSGPGQNQTVLFTVHEGLKAEVRADRGDWLQVSLPNGWNGWIPKASAGII